MQMSLSTQIRTLIFHGHLSKAKHLQTPQNIRKRQLNKSPSPLIPKSSIRLNLFKHPQRPQNTIY
jgi:hypothetical protein